MVDVVIESHELLMRRICRMRYRKTLIYAATSIAKVEAVQVGLRDRYRLNFRLHIAGWCCKLACIRECGRWSANAL